MTRFECFFDCASPWSYMGFVNALQLATRLGVQPIWRPVVVGFVFAEANRDVYLTRRLMAPPLKSAYERREMQAWAEAAGVIVRTPPKCGHPVKSVKCMRGCLALEPSGRMAAFAIAAYEALWRDGRNLGDDEVLADLCRGIGVPADAFFDAIADPGIAQQLKRNAEELVARGGFGVPTFFIDDDLMFFGNNRMALIEHYLRQGLQGPGAKAG